VWTLLLAVPFVTQSPHRGTPTTSCVWVLSAGPERSIVVNISSFDTEIDPDVLSIFDGATTSAPVSTGGMLDMCCARVA
jgi:hypothetical protein